MSLLAASLNGGDGGWGQVPRRWTAFHAVLALLGVMGVALVVYVFSGIQSVAVEGQADGNSPLRAPTVEPLKPLPLAPMPTLPALTPKETHEESWESRAAEFEAAPIQEKRIPIKFVQHHGDDEGALLKAYHLGLVGDLDGAARVYREVLARDPGNPLATVGLSAIAAASGRAERAAPRTQPSYALPFNDPALHLALGTEPEALFQQGNRHAQARQWREALTAYAGAQNLVPENPDYAFNVAVCQDHLGQGNLATANYVRALALSKLHAPAFDPVLVSQRLQSLGQ